MDTTDTVLGSLTAIGLGFCFFGVVIYVCRDRKRHTLKHSRSDTDLALTSEDAIVVHPN